MSNPRGNVQHLGIELDPKAEAFDTAVATQKSTRVSAIAD